MALTPPPLSLSLSPLPCFGHPWGNFCLNRFRKNIQLKTTSKNLKSTSKLPQNYPKTFGIGSTPPPFLQNVQKMDQKKLPQNFWIRAGPPPPFWTMSKRKQLFSQDHFPKSRHDPHKLIIFTSGVMLPPRLPSDPQGLLVNCWGPGRGIFIHNPTQRESQR